MTQRLLIKFTEIVKLPGVFTIKFALHLIIHTDDEDIMNLPWLVFHDCLMANTNRVLRGLAQDPGCRICGENEEDIEHILRSCPAATLGWNKFPWISHDELLSKPICDWLLWNLDENNKTCCDDWQVAFAMTLS